MAGMFGASREHLAEARESYWAHLRFAGAVGSMMMAAGLACCVHAVIPGICRDTASRTLRCLNGVIEDRSSLDRAAVETAEAVAFAFLLAMALALGASLWMVGGPGPRRAPLHGGGPGLPGGPARDQPRPRRRARRAAPPRRGLT